MDRAKLGKTCRSSLESIKQSGAVRVMRWMEALVERAGSAADATAEPKPWRSQRPETPVRRAAPPQRFARLTQALNFILALLALVVLMPVLLLIALAVKLTSRGPVLYTQE